MRMFNLLVVGLLLSLMVEAKQQEILQSTKTTDANFNDLLIRGKRKKMRQGEATIESDKVLDALIGVRKDFQDRVKKSENHL